MPHAPGTACGTTSQLTLCTCCLEGPVAPVSGHCPFHNCASPPVVSTRLWHLSVADAPVSQGILSIGSWNSPHILSHLMMEGQPDQTARDHARWLTRAAGNISSTRAGAVCCGRGLRCGCSVLERSRWCDYGCWYDCLRVWGRMLCNFFHRFMRAVRKRKETSVQNAVCCFEVPADGTMTRTQQTSAIIDVCDERCCYSVGDPGDQDANRVSPAFRVSVEDHWSEAEAVPLARQSSCRRRAWIPCSAEIGFFLIESLCSGPSLRVMAT